MRRRVSRLAGFIIRDQKIEDAYKNRGQKKQEVKNERKTDRQSNGI